MKTHCFNPCGKHPGWLSPQTSEDFEILWHILCLVYFPSVGGETEPNVLVIVRAGLCRPWGAEWYRQVAIVLWVQPQTWGFSADRWAWGILSWKDYSSNSCSSVMEFSNSKMQGYVNSSLWITRSAVTLQHGQRQIAWFHFLSDYIKLWAALCCLIARIPSEAGQLRLMCLMSSTTGRVIDYSHALHPGMMMAFGGVFLLGRIRTFETDLAWPQIYNSLFTLTMSMLWDKNKHCPSTGPQKKNKHG